MQGQAFLPYAKHADQFEVRLQIKPLTGSEYRSPLHNLDWRDCPAKGYEGLAYG